MNDPAQRNSSMGDRAIRIRRFESTADARDALTGAQKPGGPAKRVPLPDEIGSTPVPPTGSKDTGRPTAATTGVPSGTTLTRVSANDVNSLPADSVLDGLHIIGTYTPRFKHYLQNCLLEGTETPSVVGRNANGELTVLVNNTPSYVVNLAAYGVDCEMFRCELRHGVKLIYTGAGLVVDKCHLHDAGEDGIYANYTEKDITVKRSLFEKVANMHYESKVGQTFPQMHPDYIQLRGMLAGKRLRVETSDFRGFSPGEPYGPVGEQYGITNRCILVQTATSTIPRVEVTGSWIACGSNYAIGIRNKTYGPVGSADFANNRFYQNYQSGGTIIDSGTMISATGNTYYNTGASADSAIVTGVWA